MNAWFCGSQASTGEVRFEQRRVYLKCSYRCRRAGQAVGAWLPLKRVFAEYLRNLSAGRVDSLVAISLRCQISGSTAVRWRHRALWLIGNHPDLFTSLNRVEAVETYLSREVPGTKGGSMGPPRARGASGQGPVTAATAEDCSGYLRVMIGGTAKAMLGATSGAWAVRTRLISDSYKS